MKSILKKSLRAVVLAVVSVFMCVMSCVGWVANAENIIVTVETERQVFENGDDVVLTVGEHCVEAKVIAVAEGNVRFTDYRFDPIFNCVMKSKSRLYNVLIEFSDTDSILLNQFVGRGIGVWQNGYLENAFLSKSFSGESPSEILSCRIYCWS